MKKKSASNRCLPDDIALKAFFLGPMAENAGLVDELVQGTLHRWYDYRRAHFPEDGGCISPRDQATPAFRARKRRLAAAVAEIEKIYSRELPKHALRYLGHMSSEISIPGLLGQWIANLYNPNLISTEVAKAGAEIEEQAIRCLLRVVGFDPRRGTGHFTSGGTIANFEAIERARARFRKQGGRKPVILVPQNRHYSWDKGFAVFDLDPVSVWKVALDARARLDIADFRRLLEKARREGRDLQMVVSVAGSTEFGAIDPVDEVQSALDAWERNCSKPVWHHVDAAYGGFLRLAAGAGGGLDADARRGLLAMKRATSITIDPHKLGYVPYACGAILTRTRADYTLVSQDAPYLNYETRLDRGAYTLEGSRSGGGATATLLTERCLGFNPEGLGRVLARTVHYRRRLESLLTVSPGVILLPSNQTNIACFFFGVRGDSFEACNRRSLAFYHRHKGTRESNFYVSKTTLLAGTHAELLKLLARKHSLKADTDRLVAIRVCLMNPFVGSKEFKVDLLTEFASLVVNEKSVIKEDKNKASFITE